MSYSDLLWDNSQIVINQSHFQRSLVQDFMTSINHRIQIQENYSTQLRTLSLNLDRILNKQCPDRNYIIFALSAFKSDVVRRESQTNTFINHLREEVMSKTRVFYDEQGIEARRLEKQISIIQAGYVEVRRKMDSAKLKLSQLDKERQHEFMKLEISKILASIGKEDKERQIAKAAGVEKQYKDYDVTYRGVMKEYNTYVQEYLDSIEYYLKILQTQEEERVGKMVDNIKKIMVFESAMMRNFEYDIINIINQLNDLEKGKDIEEFAQKYSKRNSKPHQENVPKLNLRSTVIYQMLIRKLDDKIEMEATEVQRLVKAKFMQKTQNQQSQVPRDFPYSGIKSFIDNYKDSIGNLPDTKSKEIFDKEDNRNFAQLYIRHKCQINNYETDPSTQSLVVFFLQRCIFKKDVFSIRRILNLVFTQCSIKSFKDKESLLYSSIVNLALWNSHDFWEASIFQSVQEKLKGSKGQKGESKQVARTREKIAIENQLADHCNMMVMLGYNIKGLKLLASKFLKLYDLGEEQSKHLLAIIRESSDVYHQTCVSKSDKSGLTSESEKTGMQPQPK